MLSGQVQQAKEKDRKSNESTNSQKLLDDNVLTRSKKKKKKTGGYKLRETFRTTRLHGNQRKS